MKLPHNLDAEASVLGGVLVRNEVLVQLDTLEVGDFFHFPHRVVFTAMRNLEAARIAIDVVTLENEIEKDGKLDAIGGVAFLGELALRMPTVDNVLTYAGIVRERALLRRMILTADDLAERAATYDWEKDPTELLGEAMAELSALDRSKNDNSKTIGEYAIARFKNLEEMLQQRDAGELPLNGAPTGVVALDRRIGGYQFGIVNLLVARPAMGKSSAALAAVDATTAIGWGAHVFSLEDSWRSYADRALARSSGVPADRIRRAQIDRVDVAALSTGIAGLLKRTNWLVDDRKRMTAAEIVRTVRREKKRLGTRLVVVDYLNLVRGADPKMSEHERLDHTLTFFAQEADDDIAWLVLAQLNRELEKRVDKRPQYTDLRGSGTLEERPKMIVGLYRGSVYADHYGDAVRDVDYDCSCSLPNCEKVHAPFDDAEWRRMAQMVVLKNSNGTSCTVHCEWHGPTLELR